jgi:CspA family cold shock protein
MKKKFLLKGVMVALPAPLILGLILLWGASGEVILGKSLGADASAIGYLLSFLGTWAGVKVYLMTFVVFLLSFLIVGTGNGAVSGANNETSDDQSFVPGAEQGVVKWFSVSKGFGFITRNSGEDIFVHFRSIQGSGRRSLRQGQNVSFDVVDGDKGLQAENVSVVER